MSTRVLLRHEYATAETLWRLIQRLDADYATLRFFDTCGADNDNCVALCRAADHWTAATDDFIYSLSSPLEMRQWWQAATRAAVTVIAIWQSQDAFARMSLAQTGTEVRNMQALGQRVAHCVFEVRALVVAIATGVSSEVLHDCVWRPFVCSCDDDMSMLE